MSRAQFENLEISIATALAGERNKKKVKGALANPKVLKEIRAKFDTSLGDLAGASNNFESPIAAMQAMRSQSATVTESVALFAMAHPMVKGALDYLRSEKVLNENLTLNSKKKGKNDGHLNILMFLQYLIYFHVGCCDSILSNWNHNSLPGARPQSDVWTQLIQEFSSTALHMQQQGGGAKQAVRRALNFDSKRTAALRAADTPEAQKAYETKRDEVLTLFTRQATVKGVRDGLENLGNKNPIEYLASVMVLKEWACLTGSDAPSTATDIGAKEPNKGFLECLQTQVQAFNKDGRIVFPGVLPQLEAFGRLKGRDLKQSQDHEKVSLTDLEETGSLLSEMHTLRLILSCLAQALHEFPGDSTVYNKPEFHLLCALFKCVHSSLKQGLFTLSETDYFKKWAARTADIFQDKHKKNGSGGHAAVARALIITDPILRRVYDKQSSLPLGSLARSAFAKTADELQVQTNISGHLSSLLHEFSEVSSYNKLNAKGQEAVSGCAYLLAPNNRFNTAWGAQTGSEHFTAALTERHPVYQQELARLNNQVVQANDALKLKLTESSQRGRANKDWFTTFDDIVKQKRMRYLSIVSAQGVSDVCIQFDPALVCTEKDTNQLSQELSELLHDAELSIDYNSMAFAQPAEPVRQQSVIDPNQYRAASAPGDSGSAAQGSAPTLPAVTEAVIRFHFSADTTMRTLFSSWGGERKKTEKWNRFQYRLAQINGSSDSLLDAADGLFTHRLFGYRRSMTNSGKAFMRTLLRSENNAHRQDLLGQADTVAGLNDNHFINPLLEREHFTETLDQLKSASQDDLQGRRSEHYMRLHYKLVATLIQARYFCNKYTDNPVKPTTAQIEHQRRRFFSRDAERETLAAAVPRAIAIETN